MPAVQDSYAQYADAGMEGDLYSTEHATIISREVETAALSFGRAVTHGTADKGIVAGGAGDFQGVSIRVAVLPADAGDQYPVGYTASVLQGNGVVLVKPTVNVTPEDAPAFNPATGEINLAGTAIPNARFESTGAAGELVQLRLA